MSVFGDLVQSKCDAFADRVVKLNDYLLDQAANKKAEVLKTKADGKPVFKKPIPVYLQAVANICNQLLRSGTSVGANNSEATSAISKADYKSKSYIALKEARESLYWINLLHRNSYLDDKQYDSIYADADELVRLLVARCKKLDSESEKE
jgi:four helix bundle protein